MVGRKFTVFALLYLRAISMYKPGGGGGGRAYIILEGRFNGGFFALRV